MSEPVSATEAMTTAEALGRFARELASHPEIPPGAIQDLVFEAGRQLIDGNTALVVKRSV